MICPKEDLRKKQEKKKNQPRSDIYSSLMDINTSDDVRLGTNDCRSFPKDRTDLYIACAHAHSAHSRAGDLGTWWALRIRVVKMYLLPFVISVVVNTASSWERSRPRVRMRMVV